MPVASSCPIITYGMKISGYYIEIGLIENYFRMKIIFSSSSPCYTETILESLIAQIAVYV